MSTQNNTYKLAYECCDQIFIETRSIPTIDLVRERIGINSPRTIKNAMNDWVDKLARRYAGQLQQTDTPVILNDMLSDMWKLSIKEAAAKHEADRQAFQIEIQSLIDDKLNLNAVIGQLQDELTQSHQETLHLSRQVADLTTETQALSLELAARHERIEQLTDEKLRLVVDIDQLIGDHKTNLLALQQSHNRALQDATVTWQKQVEDWRTQADKQNVEMQDIIKARIDDLKTIELLNAKISLLESQNQQLRASAKQKLFEPKWKKRTI